MTNPKPTSTGSIHRLGDDLWIGVIDDCAHTVGPDTIDQVQSDIEAHMATCPDIEANQ
jgi:hypothetical protein